MAVCTMKGCSNRTGKVKKKVTFHRFPKDEVRRKQWVEAVGRENWEPRHYSTICSEHFPAEHFERVSDTLVRTRSFAVPFPYLEVNSLLVDPLKIEETELTDMELDGTLPFSSELEKTEFIKCEVEIKFEQDEKKNPIPPTDTKSTLEPLPVSPNKPAIDPDCASPKESALKKLLEKRNKRIKRQLATIIDLQQSIRRNSTKIDELKIIISLKKRLHGFAKERKNSWISKLW